MYFVFTRLRNASLVFGTQVSRAGKRVCFRKVEYPPPNVFKFYASLFSTRKNETVSTSVSISRGLFGPGLGWVGFVVADVEVLHL